GSTTGIAIAAEAVTPATTAPRANSFPKLVRGLERRILPPSLGPLPATLSTTRTPGRLTIGKGRVTRRFSVRPRAVNVAVAPDRGGGVEFRILGPLEVISDGQALDLGG